MTALLMGFAAMLGMGLVILLAIWGNQIGGVIDKELKKALWATSLAWLGTLGICFWRGADTGGAVLVGEMLLTVTMGGMATLVAFTRWADPRDVARAYRLIGKVYRTGATYLVRGLAQKMLPAYSYQQLLDQIAQYEHMLDDSQLTRDILEQGGLKGWLGIIKQGTRGTGEALKKAHRLHPQQTRDVILESIQKQHWPRENLKTIVTWMLEHPDTQIREAGIRLSQQYAQP